MNAVERSTKRVATDLKRIVRDSEELLESTADAVTDKAREARDRLVSALDQAKSACRELEGKTIASAKAADQMVRRHPYPTIGIAVVLGILAGVLLNRR